jgi:hypothetical protein
MTEVKDNTAAASMREISTPRYWRFGLRSMFSLTLVVCAALAIERLYGFLYCFVVMLFAMPVFFRRRTISLDLAVCRSVVAYLVTSIVTLPFLDSFWLGEFPVFALPQISKTELASWLTNRVILDLLRPLGWSSGSWSPDLIMAKPVGLALAYALPIGIVLAIVGWRTRFAAPYRYWLAAIVALAVIDFMMMRCYASGPGLSIY